MGLVLGQNNHLILHISRICYHRYVSFPPSKKTDRRTNHLCALLIIYWPVVSKLRTKYIAAPFCERRKFIVKIFIPRSASKRGISAKSFCFSDKSFWGAMKKRPNESSLKKKQKKTYPIVCYIVYIVVMVNCCAYGCFLSNKYWRNMYSIVLCKNLPAFWFAQDHEICLLGHTESCKYENVV